VNEIVTQQSMGEDVKGFVAGWFGGKHPPILDRRHCMHYNRCVASDMCKFYTSQAVRD